MRYFFQIGDKILWSLTDQLQLRGLVNTVLIKRYVGDKSIRPLQDMFMHLFTEYLQCINYCSSHWC